jgi:hypothetical protein
MWLLVNEASPSANLKRTDAADTESPAYRT